MSSLLDDINRIIKNEIKLIDEKTRKVAKEIANETKDEIVKKSPKNRGKYKKGWKVIETGQSYVVANSTHPGLTHLLENGHQIIKKGRNVSRVGAISHIRPAEEKGIKKFIERVKNEIEKG